MNCLHLAIRKVHDIKKSIISSCFHQLLFLSFPILFKAILFIMIVQSLFRGIIFWKHSIAWKSYKNSSIIINVFIEENMNKENKFLIISSKKRYSSDKLVSKSKLRSQSYLDPIKYHSNQKNTASEHQSSKPISYETSNYHSKVNNANFGKSHSKFYGKLPAKLRIVSENHNIKEDFKNCTQNKGFFDSIQKIIEENVIGCLIDNKIIHRNNLRQLIVKSQTMVVLLKKIILFAIKGKQQLESQEFKIINQSLSKIINLVNMQKKQIKKSKLHVQKCLPSIIINTSFSQETNTKQLELIKLEQVKTGLIEQLSQLKNEKKVMMTYYEQVKKEIQVKNAEINESSKLIAEMQQNKLNLSRQIQFCEVSLKKCKQSYEQIYHFVETQSKNLHVRLASKQYKQIESDIYDYAAYLQANQLATSQTYESLPFKNQCFVINNMENSLKEINKEIIHNDNLSLTQKFKMMRNFVLKAFQQFNKKDVEYEKLVEFKTKSIRKFVNMMKKWLDNWTFKQEYLVNLRQEFSMDNAAIIQIMQSIYHHQLCHSCTSNTKTSFQSLMRIYRKIQENYKLGNSFY